MKYLFPVILVVVVFFFIILCGCGKKEQEFSNIDVSTTPENIKKGKTLYQVNCASCHGPEGKGDGPASSILNPKPRNHTDKTYMDKLSNGRIFDVIKKGGLIVGFPQMPANPHLKDEEIKYLVAFVRSITK